MHRLRRLRTGLPRNRDFPGRQRSGAVAELHRDELRTLRTFEVRASVRKVSKAAEGFSVAFLFLAGYSARRAIDASMRAARIAGIEQAARLVAIKIEATEANVHASVAATPNKNPLKT